MVEEKPNSVTMPASALTKDNLEKVPLVSTTKLETFVQTSENSERLALGGPTPRTDMKATLESWERQWERTERSDGNNEAADKKVITTRRLAPKLNMLTCLQK
jgi:hypothetical protein